MPSSTPARPVAVISSAPWPPVRLAPAPAPPTETLTLLAAIEVTAVPSASVAFSKLKSPLIVWPAIVSSTCLPSTRMYGPAGRSPTALVRVLIESADAAAEGEAGDVEGQRCR